MDKKKKGVLIIIVVLAVGLTGLFLSTSSSVKLDDISKLLEDAEKYLTEKNYEQAFIAFNKAIEIEPKNIRAYLGATDAGVHLNKMDEVKALITKGIEETQDESLKVLLDSMDKTIAEIYIALADAYEAHGMKEKALELLKRAYEETKDEILARKLGIVEASEIVFKDDYIIDWVDPEFERLIRVYLDKPEGDIHYNDVKDIFQLQIFGNRILKPDEFLSRYSYSMDSFTINGGEETQKNGAIKSLEDLKHFESLEILYINYQPDLDISAFNDLNSAGYIRRLRELSLISNDIEDISPLSNLLALERLNLANNNIEDISNLSYFFNLNDLELSNNKKVASLEVLRGLLKLSKILINGIDEVDLNVLLELNSLEELHIHNVNTIDYNLLTRMNLKKLHATPDRDNFDIICKLTSLESLFLLQHETPFPSIHGIENLVNLKTLSLYADTCRNIEPLGKLGLEHLDLGVSKDCDLSPLKEIVSLKTLYLSVSTDEFETKSVVEKTKALLPNVEIISN